MTEPVRPSFGRLVAAFLAAPLVASLLIGMVIATASAGGMGPWLPVAFGVSFGAMCVAIPTAIILGVPTYVLLRSRVRNRLPGSVIAGAVIATSVTAALLLAVSGGAPAGLEGGPWLLGGMAAIGAVAGAVFWWVAVGAGRRGPAAR